MPQDLFLFAVSFIAVVCIRLSVWLVPEVDVKIIGKTIHHFWFGILLSALAYPLFHLNPMLGIVIFGSGLGLAADELFFMLRGGGRDKEYWESFSMVGALISLLFIGYFRIELLAFLG